nr:MAG TPA: cobalt/magnesium transport protein [Crassvirales sp.]
MLKKLSLIFIRFAPFLLALNILFKILLRYYTVSTVIISCVDLVTVIMVLVGLIILSFTFKFCIYHRILLYCVLVCYLLHFVNNILGMNFFVAILTYFFAMIVITLMIIVIYTYLKEKQK